MKSWTIQQRSEPRRSTEQPSSACAARCIPVRSAFSSWVTLAQLQCLSWRPHTHTHTQWAQSSPALWMGTELPNPAGWAHSAHSVTPGPVPLHLPVLLHKNTASKAQGSGWIRLVWRWQRMCLHFSSNEERHFNTGMLQGRMKHGDLRMFLA